MAGQINLYDPALRKKRDWLSLANVMLGAVLLLLIIIGAGWLARSGLPELNARVQAGEAQLKELQAQVQILGQRAAEQKPDVHLERELAAARRLAEMRDVVLQTLRQRLGAVTPSYADLLRGLANLAMPGVWITGFDWDAANGSMEIRGRTTDPALLGEYIRRLNREPVMRGQAFAALNIVEGKDEPVAGAPVAVPRLPPFHEFTLVPVKRESTSAADGGRG
ncbi:MAG: PilN domain-containing protein [Rhodocyclaceae bacterium]